MSTWLTANLGRGVTVDVFQRNVDRIDKFAPTGVGFQEVDEADIPNEWKYIKGTLGPDYAFACEGTHDPIAVLKVWGKITDENIVKGSKGVAKLSPARTVNEAIIDRPGIRFVFQNLHYPRNDARLDAAWADLLRAHKDRLDYWWAQNVPVIWTSDTNRLRFPPLHGHERTLAHHGLDVVRYLPARKGTPSFEKHGDGTINLTIDGHNGQYARGAWKK